MASPGLRFQQSKPSFAKVAAMALPTTNGKSSSTPALKGPPKPTAGTRSDDKERNALALATGLTGQPPADTEENSSKTPKTPTAHLELSHGVKKLQLGNAEHSLESLSNMHAGDHIKASSSEDEQSRLSGSSSKIQNYDTKSITSVMTFQMDEKDSLRPDDSASVQAAEDNDSSINSRVGSDIGHGNSTEMLGKPLAGRAPIIVSPTGLTLSSVANLQQNPALRHMTFVSGERLQTSDAQSTLNVVPDEKLLEAMTNPKDRLFLLQLEEKIVAFINESQDDWCELPPQNSFGRMLAHKLADYYNLNHFIANDISIVRLHKTPATKLPPPMNSHISSLLQSVPGPTTASFKIMRRAGASSGKASANAGTPASSSVPSKATSDAGVDTASEEGIPSPSELNAARDKTKLTREEREAAYEAARRRIFADLPEPSEPLNGHESSTSISRSSSASGKRRGHKQRTPKDDSFEARSQFNAFYPGMSYAGNNQLNRQSNPTYPQTQYVTQSHAHSPSQGLGVPGMAFPQFEAQQFNQMPQFPVGPSSLGPNPYGPHMGWPMMPSDGSSSLYSYDHNNGSNLPTVPHHQNLSSAAVNHFSQPLPHFQAAASPWMPASFQSNFQQNSVTPNSPPIHWPGYGTQSSTPGMSGSSGPYQYNQFQQQFPGVTAAHQQLHGNFNRAAFNPQIRSFVPNNKPARFPIQSTPPQTKSSNHAIQNFHLGQDGPPVNQSSSVSRVPSQPPNVPQSQPLTSEQESLQKKWGTPAHLPKKPPPSEVPPAYEMDSAIPLPSQQQGFGSSVNGSQRNGGAPLVMQSGNSATQAYASSTKVLAGGS